MIRFPKKNIGRGRDGVSTNPIRQKPCRHTGLWRRRQREISAPKSRGNGVITSSTFKIPVGTTGCREGVNMKFMCRSRKGTVWSPVQKKRFTQRYQHRPNIGNCQAVWSPTRKAQEKWIHIFAMVTNNTINSGWELRTTNPFTYLPCGVLTRPWLQTK